MFDSPDDAQKHLVAALGRARTEIVVQALVPTLTFRPAKDRGSVLGATRIGGTPDLPPGLAWPRRAMPKDVEAIAKRGNEDAAAEMRAHFKLEAPYAFIAQIDLSEAAALGAPARDLPDHGRLLVFYDLMAGPWDAGSESVRVIWDQAPRESLVAQPKPEATVAAEAAYRRGLAEAYAKWDMKPPQDDTGTPYAGPGRGMSLRAELRPPVLHSFEAQALPAYKALFEDRKSGSSPLSELLARRYDPFYDKGNSGRRNQLLGSPLPEQDEPRYDAATLALTGRQHPSSEERKTRRAEIEAEAKTWRLLLQIDLADFHQEQGEGTLYVLIRGSDLLERRFDRAIAVYQQT